MSRSVTIARRCRSSWVWLAALAALAMLAQALAPALRARHLGAADGAPAVHAAHCHSGGSAGHAPQSPGHDEATCELCHTIAAGNVAAFHPIQSPAIDFLPVRFADDVPHARAATLTTTGSRTSRGPPARA